MVNFFRIYKCRNVIKTLHSDNVKTYTLRLGLCQRKLNMLNQIIAAGCVGKKRLELI